AVETRDVERAYGLAAPQGDAGAGPRRDRADIPCDPMAEEDHAAQRHGSGIADRELDRGVGSPRRGNAEREQDQEEGPCVPHARLPGASGESPRNRSLARSATAMTAALMGPVGIRGMTEASIT